MSNKIAGQMLVDHIQDILEEHLGVVIDYHSEKEVQDCIREIGRAVWLMALSEAEESCSKVYSLGGTGINQTFVRTIDEIPCPFDEEKS